jgi:predicted P-loop ATPase
MVRNGLKDFPGVEFKALGRQLVGPGSIHPDSGREYAVASGSPDKIAEAPAALLALIRRTAVPFEEVGTGQYVNDAATQGRYVDYLEHQAPTSGSFLVACRGRDLGLPPATTWELMCEVWAKRRTSPRTPEELRAKVTHAYRYASGPVGNLHRPPTSRTPRPLRPPPAAPKEEELSWVTTKQGAVVKCFQNLLTYFSYSQAGLTRVFGYNEFTGRVEFTRPAPWHHGRLPSYLGVGDNDLKLLKGHLAVKHGFEMPVQNIEEAVTVCAHDNRFHPVREYLYGLKWDGKPRLDNWLHEFLGVEDSEYTRACARKVLCAAVMRVMKPGIKFDHVLVLEGAQGIGKSSVCHILGGEHSADFPIDPHDKDTVQQMQGKWIMELAELEVTRRADMQALKAFVSRRKDEARLAYGRTVGEFPRQSIFIGSINPGADKTYLQDDENRRWWPVACHPKGGQVNFRAFKDARNQLWAEAVHVVKNVGEHLYMETAELKKAARDVVGERHADHAWTERVATWLEECDKKPETQKSFLTAREVYIDAMGGIEKQLDRRATLAVASALRELGWERGFRRINGRFTRVFVRTLGQQGRVLADARDVLGSFA